MRTRTRRRAPGVVSALVVSLLAVIVSPTVATAQHASVVAVSARVVPGVASVTRETLRALVDGLQNAGTSFGGPARVGLNQVARNLPLSGEYSRLRARSECSPGKRSHCVAVVTLEVLGN